ncbi:MAG: Rrf2 family transcriptional regulator [Pseudomonadota bacterium]|nr:Rrf2 family transcriptional regulator [Pseudomonadota bacterium]
MLLSRRRAEKRLYRAFRRMPLKMAEGAGKRPPAFPPYGLPLFYLAKLIQPPTRAGWLTTVRGRGGGVKLTAEAETITLLDILHLTDGHRVTTECLLGFKACEDETACVLHCQWKPIKQELTDGLGGYSLAALANSALPPWLLRSEDDESA